MTKSLSLTLTIAGTVYDLMTLINADTNIAAETDSVFPNQVMKIDVQASGGTITFVDKNGDTGLVLADGDVSTDFGGAMNAVDLTGYKLKGGTNGTKANIKILVN